MWYHEGVVFEDRREAGKLLAGKLEKYKDKDVVVLGIPRGGVPVAAEVAKALKAPLDVVVARKLGAPGNPELAIGAIDSQGNTFLHEELVARLGVDKAYLERVKREEREEAKRREEAFRGEKLPLSLEDKTVIVVDDGIATGATTLAAVRSVRARNPKKVVLAVPVASSDSAGMLKAAVDQLVVLSVPYFFAAVGQFYRKFEQASDEEVKKILESFEKGDSSSPAKGDLVA